MVRLLAAAAVAAGRCPVRLTVAAEEREGNGDGLRHDHVRQRVDAGWTLLPVRRLVDAPADSIVLTIRVTRPRGRGEIGNDGWRSHRLPRDDKGETDTMNGLTRS
jgi:hypothetical protein